ncbi:MAG: hypothetical protein SPJ13_03100 [Bacteroidales bacterium]|nr:hypothetical protein [Bacteroidales bacterium]
MGAAGEHHGRQQTALISCISPTVVGDMQEMSACMVLLLHCCHATAILKGAPQRPGRVVAIGLT